jgi:flagellar hook-basal body complex protein FliE
MRKNWAKDDPQFDHMRPDAKKRSSEEYKKDKISKNLKKDIDNVSKKQRKA